MRAARLCVRLGRTQPDTDAATDGTPLDDTGKPRRTPLYADHEALGVSRRCWRVASSWIAMNEKRLRRHDLSDAE